MRWLMHYAHRWIMLFDAVFTHYFFRIINFSVISALLLYFFKKYGYDSMKKQMKKQEHVSHDLKAQQQSLIMAEKRLDEELVEDAHLCELLKNRVMQWHAYVEQELATRKQLKQERIKQVSERMRVKAADWSEYQMRAQVMPLALQKAEHALQAQFANQKAGQTFIEQIIAHIPKT
jgi:hypothetical protein